MVSLTVAIALLTTPSAASWKADCLTTIWLHSPSTKGVLSQVSNSLDLRHPQKSSLHPFSCLLCGVRHFPLPSFWKLSPPLGPTGLLSYSSFYFSGCLCPAPVSTSSSARHLHGRVMLCTIMYLLLLLSWLPPLCLASTMIDRMAFPICNFTIPNQPLPHL